MDDGTIDISVSCTDDISVVFKLNVSSENPNPNPNRYYGKLFIHLTMLDAPSPLFLKSYDFTNFIQIIPELQNITETNFIQNIQGVISMLQFILHNNKNPWLRLEDDATPPNPYYVDLKTEKSSWELPHGIHPWTRHVDEHGRTYYLNSLMNESSWNPAGQEGTHLNIVLNQIIECLKTSKTQSDLQSNIATNIAKKMAGRRAGAGFDRDAAHDADHVLQHEQLRLAARAQMMNMKIDRVFVISGHSICGRTSMDLTDPNMIAVTLSKLHDKVIGYPTLNIHHYSSGIIKTFKSSQPDLPTVSSIVDMLVDFRSKKIVFPGKVQEGSIKARRGRHGSKNNNTLTNQYFFGNTREKDFTEGVFMYSKNTLSGPVDISSMVLTPTGKKNLYEETTDFQKRIIDFESKHPESTDLDLERHFAAESEVTSEKFKTEWRNLKLQRRLFCNSFKLIDSIESCVMSCKGIDVMVLQMYYDLIVKWEKRNKKNAFEYFKEDKERIKKFMEESRLDPNDKKIEGLLMMLIDKRKQQFIKQLEQQSKLLGKKVEPNELTIFDSQRVPSLYEQASSSDILNKINSISLYRGQKKLVIFHGCRVVVGEDVEKNPFDSDDDEEGFSSIAGGERQKYKINRKNTNKKKKNAYSKKKKNAHSKKKKKIKSCNNKK